MKKVVNFMKSPRLIVSLLTLIILGLIVYLSRHELVKAWYLLLGADLWLLSLLVPFQIIVYLAGGEMMFSYLRNKQLVGGVSRLEQARIALELNLVNHIFPSGGVSGISYATWRMHWLGVSPAKSTFAQVIRHVAGFVATMTLLIVAVLFLAIDGDVNRYIVASSFLLVLLIVGLTALVMFMFSSQSRLYRVAQRLTRAINTVVRWLTFTAVSSLLEQARVVRFFEEMREDYDDLLENKSLLRGPFFWGIAYTVFDVLMFMVVFWSLGVSVNPAILLVGYGVAGLAALMAFTPGGAGFYEVVMIFFLSMAGISTEVAIAGIVLTRSILVIGTVFFGYIFYQHALIKYGKNHDSKV